MFSIIIIIVIIICEDTYAPHRYIVSIHMYDMNHYS